MSEMDTVEIEISTGERRELSRSRARPDRATVADGRIYAEDNGVRWPFDGEFWPDEVTQYRREIDDRCR